MPGLDDAVVARRHRHQVGGEGRGRVEPPGAAAVPVVVPAEHARVAAHLPGDRGAHRHREGALQVRLVKARKDLVCVEGLEVGVEVDLLVSGVDDPVEAHPHPFVGAVGDDLHGGGPDREAGERDACAVVAGHCGAARLPADAHLPEPPLLAHGEVEEGVRARATAGDADPGRAAEGGRRRVVAQLEVDAVAEVDEQAGALHRLHLGEVVTGDLTGHGGQLWATRTAGRRLRHSGAGRRRCALRVRRGQPPGMGALRQRMLSVSVFYVSPRPCGSTSA